MSQTFKTWQEAHAYAQDQANKTGLSLGIEKPTAFERQWLVRYLPRRENRFGHDLRCEAVEPEVSRG